MPRTNVVLHIGLHKTGTTSIQHWLRDHEDVLAESGARFPRGWLRLNNHFELPLVFMRQDRMMHARTRGDEWRDPEWRIDVCEQVADDLAAHRNELTILSCEGLSLFRYDDEVGPLRDLIGDAEVIVYLRKPADFLASLSAHYHKAGMPGLSRDPDAYNYCAPGTWLADYPRLLAPWRRSFSRVWVANYDSAVAVDGSVVPSFLHHLRLPAFDTDAYHLNQRADAVPRVEGNRAAGLRFGQVE